MTRYEIGLRHPDFVQCANTSARAVYLELRTLVANERALASPAFYIANVRDCCQ